MNRRIEFFQIAREGLAPLGALEAYLRTTSLERALLELVKVLASIINGCDFCIEGHTKAARARGEREERLRSLCAWRGSGLFTEAERAVFAWTEAVTKIGDGLADDARYTALRIHFSEKEVVDLTLAIVAINAWNRLHTAFDSQIKAQ